MKIRRRFVPPMAAGALAFLSFISAARAQNRPPATAAPSSSQPSTEEQILFDAANRERVSQGLQLLRWDSLLATAARQHALIMMRENDVSHQCAGEPSLQERAGKAGARFSFIAENIALGPDASEIHNGWMHSPGHRKNILSPEITSVGIGAVRGNRGLFAVQDFSRPVPALSLEQQEEEVMSLLSAQGLKAADSDGDARRICKANGSFSGGNGGALKVEQPQAVFRFERADLSQLPEELLKTIHGRPFHKAAVGACGSSNATGFVLYRIAVVLY